MFDETKYNKTRRIPNFNQPQNYHLSVSFSSSYFLVGQHLVSHRTWSSVLLVNKASSTEFSLLAFGTKGKEQVGTRRTWETNTSLHQLPIEYSVQPRERKRVYLPTCALLHLPKQQTYLSRHPYYYLPITGIGAPKSNSTMSSQQQSDKSAPSGTTKQQPPTSIDLPTLEASSIPQSQPGPTSPQLEKDAARAMSGTSGWQPSFDRRQSYRQEDLRRELQMGSLKKNE
ncbi:hypothetical protein F5Y16DRAFT_361478 [Xylariaceae sp. FL0255]|nr:hypothetical protein F5Y16DRAFT_361478 [Xylariaceae sp. FL0255]